MIRRKQFLQIVQIVGLWDVHAEFFQQGLQVFLGRLLAMETNLIM